MDLSGAFHFNSIDTINPGKETWVPISFGDMLDILLE
jgi:hypothetical protein